jgi:hypothetical protein
MTEYVYMEWMRAKGEHKMPLFSKADLRNKKSFRADAFRILFIESRRFKTTGYDIFMSHCFLDAEYIYAIKSEIENQGFSVYVDWLNDPQLDRSKVSKKNAQRIRERMEICKCLFFIVTENAGHSVWMPWELGYFDGMKSKVAILPITENVNNTDQYAGQEYLGLYSYVTQAVDGSLRIHNDETTWVGLREWLHGTRPA